MTTGAFLALDWGTTNLRAWVVGENGETLRRNDFALGVGGLQPGEAGRQFCEVVRPGMEANDLPAILCGMIGSTLGWEVVPYVECPADFGALKSALHRVDNPGAPVWIVPGLKAERPDGGPDVMRGEETQLFGWAMGDSSRREGEHLICLPGTHAKWVRMIDGRVESFVTSMTGELFALLRKHSVLRVAEARDDDEAFTAGLKAAGDGGALASRLFTARSKVVGGDMNPLDVESYMSGLLIGAESASLPALFAVDRRARVTIIGDRALGARYRQALAGNGFDCEVIDGDDTSLAGMKALMAPPQ